MATGSSIGIGFVPDDEDEDVLAGAGLTPAQTGAPTMAQAAQQAVSTAKENVGILESARRAGRRSIAQEAARGTAFAMPAGGVFGGGRAYAAQQGALEGAARMGAFDLQSASALAGARSTAAEAMLGQAGVGEAAQQRVADIPLQMTQYAQGIGDADRRIQFALQNAVTAQTAAEKNAWLAQARAYGSPGGINRIIQRFGFDLPMME